MKWQHRPGLDALRAFAVIAVVGAHFRLPGFTHGGEVGVEVFFVLSGYLITSLDQTEPTSEQLDTLVAAFGDPIPNMGKPERNL